MRKYLFIPLILIFTLVGCNVSEGAYQENKSRSKAKDIVHYFNLKTPYSGWQGVATDGENIYISTDRDKNFELMNTISVYSMDGEYINEINNAYTKTDTKDRFMSFGDLTFIEGYLFATVYNINGGGGNEPISRIIKYSVPDLEIVGEYELGDGTAESVAKKDDYYYVVYHDRNHISKFDGDFNFIESFPLSQKFEEEGGYQGIFFEGNDFYGNLHGSNELGEKYAQGLDHYKYNGKGFEFIERIKPPTYGAGQGIEANNDRYYWADRTNNRIIITEHIKTSRNAKEVKIGN